MRAGDGVFPLFGLPGFLLVNGRRPAGALASPVRQRVFSLIALRPGISVNEIAKALSLTWGAASYHVEKLEAAGEVTTRAVGRKRIVYPEPMPADETPEDRALLQEETCRRIARTIAASPGQGVADVVRTAGVSQRVAYYHIRRLIAAGLVSTEKPTGYRGLSPTVKLYILLADLA